MTTADSRHGRDPDRPRRQSEGKARFSIVIAQGIDLPGVTDAAEAWHRAEAAGREVANVLAKYGVPEGHRAPLCNVWENPE